MTKEEHIARHQELHRMFDELFADFIMCHPGEHAFLSRSIQELMEWSYKQTQEPDDPTAKTN